MRGGEGLLFETEDGRSRFLVRIGMPPVVVGRQPPFQPQNIRVPSRLVSRQHARIVTAPNGYFIEDAGSSGGTYLDGERVAGPRPIGAGARLQLTGDTVYVTRTFAGESLGELRARGGGEEVALPATLALARDVLRALRPLHQAGELHGNLDPHHVMYDEGGHGWTVLIDGWTVLDPEGSLSCSPVYVAPEVFERQDLAVGSDIYALGLLLFETLHGFRPFPDDDPQQNIMAKLFGGAPDWRGVPVSDAVRDFFLHLLAFDPHRRADISRALELIYELRPELRLR